MNLQHSSTCARSSITGSTCPTPPKRCSRRSPASASRSASSRTSSACPCSCARASGSRRSRPPARSSSPPRAARCARLRNLKRVADEYRGEDTGTLSIATTHTQARYVLPKVLREFATRYPKVKVVLHQGNPMQVAEQTANGEVDIGIATEALADYPELVTLPCYEWNRVVLVPKRHPLAKMKPLTIEALAKFPIVTYDFSFTGRSAINAAFAAKGLEPNVVLTALDSDVIKTYVELGMGVGIIAQMAYDPVRDTRSRCSTPAHLFAPSTTRLGLRHGVFLRGLRVRVHRAVRAAATTAPPSMRRSRAEARNERPRTRRRRGARAPRASWGFAALLASLSMLGPFSVDMYLPAFPGDRPRVRRAAIAHAADAVGVHVRVRVHDAVARRAVRRARPPAGRASPGSPSSRSARSAARSPATSSRCGCFARAAGTLRGHGPRRRPRDHPRPLPRRRSAAHDVADHARVRHRAGARADRRRRASEHAGLALDILGAARFGSSLMLVWARESPARNAAPRASPSVATARAVAQLP